jgi:hypothetical protein
MRKPRPKKGAVDKQSSEDIRKHPPDRTNIMAVLSALLTLLLTAASGYATYFSAQSIPKLQKYEDKAQKAAEWSNVATKQLWDTRYTVGAGFIFVSCFLFKSQAQTACMELIPLGSLSSLCITL